MKVRDVMTTKVVAISPHNNIRHAIGVMLDRHVGGLPVVDDDGRLVGILTEGDLLRRLELGIESVAAQQQSPSPDEAARAYVKSHGWSVGDVMTRDPVVVDEDMPLVGIAAIMAERRVKRFPVTRSGELIGIVSRTDLLKAIATVGMDGTASGDDAIRRSVMTRLHEAAEVNGVDLSATVYGGVVHLWGAVGLESGRDAARVVAQGVHGVEGVVDHLTVAVVHPDLT